MAGALEIARRALDELGFFSKALEEAKGAKMKSGTVQQWKNTLQKQGVKPAELDATGFSALPPDKPLSKDDLVDFLTQNRVQLSEKKLGAAGSDEIWSAIEEQKRKLDSLATQIGQANNDIDYARLRAQYSEADQQLDALISQRNARRDAEPKYENWSLPGGQNYQETLLTLPQPPKPKFEVVMTDGYRAGPFATHRDAVRWQDGEGVGLTSRIVEAAPSSNGGPPTFGPHRNPHWEDPNVVAHYRTKDRIGPNGERVLHIDEVQSDWGQQGASEGFFDPKLEQARKEAEAAHTKAGDAYMQAVRDHQSYVNANHPHLDPENKLDIWELQPLELARQERMTADPGWRASVARIEEARRHLDQVRRTVPIPQERNGTVPPAPFVTDEKAWTELALKRAMIEAERGGYDALAFTRGAEQAERYNLQNRVGDMVYHPRTGELYINGPDGFLLHNDYYAPEKLAGVIGKENAERLMAAQADEEMTDGWRRLVPEDMVWGGKGMIRYYDQALPSRVQSLARSLDPEARLETMPAGRRMGIESSIDPVTGERMPGARVYEQTDLGDAMRGNVGTFSREFPTYDEARAFVDANHYPRGQIPDLNLLRLTPRMKEQIRQGLPLFVGAPAVVGGALSQAQQWQAPEANEFARGGRVQAFEAGGYADRGYDAPDVSAALGPTDYGSWDTTSRGFAGQDFEAGNTGYLGSPVGSSPMGYGFGLGGELGRTVGADFGPTMQGWETNPDLQGWQHDTDPFGGPGNFEPADLPSRPPDPVNEALGRGWSPIGGGWDTTELGVRGLNLRESIFPDPGQTRVGQHEARTGEYEDVQGLVGKLAPMDFSLPQEVTPTFSPGYIDAFPGRPSNNVIDVRSPATVGQRPSEVNFTQTNWNTPQATSRGATAPGASYEGRPVHPGLESYVTNVMGGMSPSMADLVSKLGYGFARGGSVERDQQRMLDIERASPSDEMLEDRAYRNYVPGYDRLLATRPIGGTDAVRLPKVQRFEVGGYADRGYDGTDAGWGGSSLADALGNTSFGGFDFGGITGGGGYVGNTGSIGVGDYTGGLGAALGDVSGGSFGVGAGEGIVGGSEPMGGSGWGGAGEGNYGQPEPGYSGNAGAIMEGAGLGNVFGSENELSQSYGMLGANLLDPTPIAEQNVDRANAVATADDFTPPVDATVALATTLPSDMPAPNFGRAAREQEYPAEVAAVDFRGPQTEKQVGPYTEDGVRGLSPQGVRNLAGLSANEAMPIARAIARREGISLEEAMPAAYQHVVETVLNRSTLGPRGFGGQTYNPSITDVMNARAQFSGVPGTFGAGRAPGRVNELPASPQDIEATLSVLRDLEAGNRAYPNVTHFANASIPSVAAKEWVQDMVADPASSRIGYGSASHWMGNPDDRRVGTYDITVPDMAGYAAPASAPAGRSMISELLGITPAQAAEPTVASPGTGRMGEDIPEIDIWQGEKNILQGIARGLRSITGTTEDGTQPMPAAPVGPDYGFSRSFPTDTMGPGSRGNALAGGLYNAGQRMALETPAQPGPELSSWERGLGTPLPDLPAPIEVAGVPMPPERPSDLPVPADDPGQGAPSRSVQVAADETMPSSNRWSIDPLTGRMYDPVTGDRVIDPRYVSRGVDAVLGLTPVGPFNSLLALAGGVTGYPLSGGQLMALGRPGAPGGYSVNEGSIFTGRPTEVAAGLRATSGGGGGALSTVAATTQGRLPDYIAREFLGVDQSPETYGTRGQRSYYSYG